MTRHIASERTGVYQIASPPNAAASVSSTALCSTRPRQGSQPLVSFQYGRGDRAACRKLLRYALTTVCIAAPVLFLGLYVFAPQLVRLYLSHAGEELVAYSARAFRHYSVSYLFLGFNIVIGGFLTAQIFVFK